MCNWLYDTAAAFLCVQAVIAACHGWMSTFTLQKKICQVILSVIEFLKFYFPKKGEKIL